MLQAKEQEKNPEEAGFFPALLIAIFFAQAPLSECLEQATG